MELHFVNVIVVREGVVDENILVADFNREQAAKRAEQVFIDKCGERISNWDEYTHRDMEEVLGDGFAKFGTGSVCISWPEDR